MAETIDSLQIEINSTASNVADGINKLKSTMSKLQAAVGKTHGDLSKCADDIDDIGDAAAGAERSTRVLEGLFTRLRSAIDKNGIGGRLNSELTQTLKSTSNAGKLFSRLNIAGLFERAADGVAKVIAGHNQYIEDMNLFTVSMGKYADSAQRYANNVSAVMGIDPAAWMRDQAMFMTLANGFGVASDKAALMSKNLTQLAYDGASFLNLDIANSVAKLQSGIAGEIEPLRRVGVDISQARLQTIAYEMGIDRLVSSMTQAEKAQLRYVAIMQQTSSWQGDMARTLSAPNNQLRILQAQVTMAGRAIGSIFIPALNAVLPVAIAVMQAIRGVATAIASLFGYSLPEVSYTAGLDSVTDSANNAAGGLGNAAGAAKKLKNYLMGFDELNVIPDQSGGGGGGGSGGAGGGVMSGFDFELPEYDFLADAVESNVDRIYKKIEPVVEWIKDNLDSIGSLTLSIGGALASLGIAKSFIPDINLGIGALNSLKSVAAGVAAIGIMVGLVYTFDKKAIETGDPWQFVADGLSTLFGSLLTGGIARHAAQSAGADATGVGSFFGGVSFIISAFTSIIATYEGAKAQGIDGAVIATGVMGVIKSAIGGALIASALGMSLTAGAGIGFTVAAAVTTIVLMDAVIPDNSVAPDFGDVEWSAAEIKSAVESLYTFPVSATVSLLNATLDDVHSATQRVNSAVASVEASIVPLRFGIAMDADGLNNILSASNALVAEFNALDENRKQALNVAISVSPLLNHEGTDVSGEAVGMFGQASSILQSQMTSLGNDLAYWVEQGAIDGMEGLATEMIGKISTEMLEMSSAFAQGEAIGKFEGDIASTLANMDAESFTNFAKEYAAMEDEFVNSMVAGTQETIISARAYGNALRTAGEEELADTMDAFAKSVSIQETKAFAESTAVPNIGDEVLTGVRDIFSESFDASMGDFVSSFGLRGYLEEAFLFGETDVNVLAAEVSEMLNEVLLQSSTGEQREAFLSASNTFGFTGWDVLSSDIQNNLYNALADALGAERTNAMFEALGYSIPTAIQTGIDNADSVKIPEIPVPDVTPLITGLAASMATVETDVAIKLGNSWANEWVESFGGNVDTPEAMRTLASNFGNAIHNALYSTLGGESYAATINAAEAFGLTGWDLLAADVQTNLYNTLAEAIGDDKATELFESLGYSIPSAIQTGIDSAGPVDVEVSTSTTSSSTTSGSSTNLTSLGLAASNLAITAAAQVASAQTQFEGAVSSAQSAADSVKTSWGEVGSYMQTDVFDPIEDGFTGMNWNGIGKDAARGLRAGLMSIKLPNFSVKWSTKQQSFSLYGQEMTLSIPLPKISFYAGGGFPDSGELFMANENGASELVGRIGNRSAVANQDQIGDAIFQYMDAHAEENGMDEERLAAAMVSAMRSAGIGSVYIDGRRITQAINRESQRSGKPALNY